MANCKGKRSNKTGTCASTLFRCKACGNVGCDASLDLCSNQAFRVGRCKRCGKAGAKELF